MSDSMWFIELGTICVTVAVVVRVWWLVVQVLRARNKRRLLSRMFGVVSDSPDFIGISAICHDIDSVSQVADLLDVEYASYELLVVMDARLNPDWKWTDSPASGTLHIDCKIKLPIIGNTPFCHGCCFVKTYILPGTHRRTFHDRKLLNAFCHTFLKL